jgi:hypothetical protein
MFGNSFWVVFAFGDAFALPFDGSSNGGVSTFAPPAWA